METGGLRDPSFLLLFLVCATAATAVATAGHLRILWLLTELHLCFLTVLLTMGLVSGSFPLGLSPYLGCSLVTFGGFLPSLLRLRYKLFALCPGQ